MSGWKGAGMDIRFVLRGLVRARGFTVTSLMVLAVAVAVNTAVFAFVRGTLLESPPYERPDQLVFAWGSNPVNGQIRDVVSGSNFVDLKDQMPGDVFWTAQYVFGGYSYQQIAIESGRHATGRSTVTKAVKDVADAIGLDLVKKQPGRPSKKG